MADMTDDQITAAAIEQARELPEPTREQACDEVCSALNLVATMFLRAAPSRTKHGALRGDALSTIRRLDHAARLLRQDGEEVDQLRARVAELEHEASLVWVTNMTRWSLRRVDDPDYDPLFDGMETDEAGKWVQWEDAAHRVDALEKRVAELEERLGLARMCVTCGRIADVPRGHSFPECGDEDHNPCSFDMTLQEAAQYWRDKYHNAQIHRDPGKSRAAKTGERE